jgi:hypothetical protein
VVTPTRDPDAEVRAWQERRAARRERARRLAAEAAAVAEADRPRRWWSRRR